MQKIWLSLGLLGMVGCSHLYPYNGVVGYQWHPTEASTLIFIDEDRLTWRAVDMRAAQACERVLKSTPKVFKILKHDTISGHYNVHIQMPAGIIDGRRELANEGFNSQNSPAKIYSKERVARQFKQVTMLCQ